MKISLGKEFLSNADWLKKAANMRFRMDAMSRFFQSRNYSAQASIRSRAESVAKLFQQRNYPDADELFFSFEDLPMMGKEYWFLHFCVPGSKQQAVLTFGRAEGDVQVNRKAVKANGQKRIVPLPGDAIKCAAVCWMYSDRKKVVLDSHADVKIGGTGGNKRLCATSGKSNEVCIEGDYPHYRVQLVKGGKKIFSAKVCQPKKGIPFEIVQMLRSPFAKGFGAVMVNYYFDFSGTMDGRKVCGKAYLQKVVAAMPLAPWNWVRISFSGGAGFDFFAAKPFGNTPAEIHFACNDYLEINGKRIRPPSELKLESWFDGEGRKWLLSGKDFYLAMESYSVQPFVMRQKTVFRYDEYLVKVTDFAMKAGGRTYRLSGLGEGSGMVEDASGYLI